MLEQIGAELRLGVLNIKCMKAVAAYSIDNRTLSLMVACPWGNHIHRRLGLQ